MRYLLIHTPWDDKYYVTRYYDGMVAETSEISAAIIPDDPLTETSFTDHTFYPYDPDIIINAEEIKNYETKTGLIKDADFYSTKFIEQFFPA